MNKRHKPMRAAAVLVGILATSLALSGCGRTETTPPDAATSGEECIPADALVGVAFPQKTSENWIVGAEAFTTGLEEAGFTADVQFANAGVSEQQNQISAMVTKGADVIVVGAIDGSQLGNQLEQAKAAGATVIAYDRMLTNTEAVDYYLTFDLFKIGQLQGEALMAGLAERKPEGPYTIELFAGSPDDSNSKVFLEGAMSVLQPKIDDGTLVVGSGQVSFEQIATQGWKAENAQKRMDTLLAANYQSTVLDGVLSPNDNLARAIITSVMAAGKDLPIVTGQDSEVESVKSIVAGEQYSTIYKDARAEAAQTIEMIKSLQKCDEPEINDTESFDNGVKVLPTYLLTPVSVTQDNAADAYKDDPTLSALTK